MTDTLIADTDGIYHPGLFNDRMLLGMKSTMGEALCGILIWGRGTIVRDG